MAHEIINPAGHTHRPITMGGQQVCQDCNEVLINPILTSEDFAARQPTTPPPLVPPLLPGYIDFALIDLRNPWPDYIDKLADRYNGDPPHARGR